MFSGGGCGLLGRYHVVTLRWRTQATTQAYWRPPREPNCSRLVRRELQRDERDGSPGVAWPHRSSILALVDPRCILGEAVGDESVETR